jgi:hypothetical protein
MEPQLGGEFTMDKIQFRHLIVVILILSILTGCTMPGFSTPTPFSFPTPDKTMTALFEPTPAGIATSAPGDATDGDGTEVTDTPKAPTDTPEPTETEPTPTETGSVAITPDPDDEYAGPAIRGGPVISADWMSSGPGIDGDLSGWDPPIQKVINYVVWGGDKWSGKQDSSGTVVAGWNETYLFLGVRVKDDKYVQKATKAELYLGDSIEIVFDRYISADFHLQSMSADDYQIGISPGINCIATTINGVKLAAIPVNSNMTTSSCNPPEAYIWFPKTEAGRTTNIKIGALEGSEGYQVEMRIPWSLLGVTNPSAGDHYGFAVSISDNDKAGTKNQQSMTSNVSTRIFSNPTTWGNLYLKKK